MRPSAVELAFLATGRRASLLAGDVAARDAELRTALTGQRVLVIGGAGSIGAATVAELARFDLAALHLVDTSENGLVEVVRDLRSRATPLAARDLRTLPVDFGTPTMRRYLDDHPPYGLVLNFAALKHVRSEKDSYSLLHMLDTNVVKAERLLDWLAARGGTRRYFSVSTDKAANPVNLMGASKRLMEHVIFSHEGAARAGITVTSARFANVAFSAGSLLEGWLLRLEKRQPLAVPRDTRRFFVSMEEAGQLCLLAAVCGADRHLVIPRLDPASHLVPLDGIARALLRELKHEPREFDDETAARAAATAGITRDYPLLLTALDTAGEKAYEEFVGDDEEAVDLGFASLLGVRYRPADAAALRALSRRLAELVSGAGPTPTRREIAAAVGAVVRELRHKDSDQQLDQRM